MSLIKSKELHEHLKTLPEKTRIEISYALVHGIIPDIEHPKTFNEKIQWRKLHERTLIMTKLSDKQSAKEFVYKVIEKRYGEYAAKSLTTESLYVSRYVDADMLNSISQPFVMKARHGSGWNHFVYDYNIHGLEKLVNSANQWTNSTYGEEFAEWSYKDAEKGIIIEHFLKDDSKQNVPVDYKIFVFHNKPQFIQVDFNRYTDHSRLYYDTAWKLLPFTMRKKKYDSCIICPKSLQNMLEFATILSTQIGTDFIRVDFYEIQGKSRFSEFTFYPESGLGVFSPIEYDRIIGDMWKI